MTNEVNNEAEVPATGEDSAVEQTPRQEVPETAPKPAAETPVDEPQTSGDVDFGSILEQFEQEQTVYHAGELVEGKVVGINDRGILVDFGYKAEGIIPAEEAAAATDSVNVGDTIEVVIKAIHAGDAPPVLSRVDAKMRKVWNEVEEAYKEDRTITGRIIDKTKGGLRVDVNGLEAFLPGSQIDSRPIRSLDAYKGQDIEAKIIKFSRRRNNIVLSRKVITDLVLNEQKSATLNQIEVGFVIEGTIKNLTEYGAFVDIGGIDGLLHVTDMSWGRLQNPGDQFKVNDHIQIKVLKLDREKEKVSLGYKQLLPDPWSTVIEVYPVNTKVTGKVSSVTEYGIFVELESGVEGLVHVSEISWSKRSANPKRMFHRGDDLEVQVLGVDTVEKRISLGMKQLQDNPWDNIEARYPVGTKIHGRVRNLTDFGAFVELEEGIDGLVHVSDITWAKKLKHPKELLKKDQEVDAIVTNIDSAGQRLSLSMKDLTPSAWEGFVATHRPGDTVRGKISRFTSFGVFVELSEGLEGLCHISELSDERVENAESVVKLGQELDFKILRIENDDQKIGLSYRAVGKEDEPVVDSRVYSTEAKGGMASLGELANLMKGGTSAEEEPKTELSKEEKEEAKKEKKARAKQEYEEAEAAKTIADSEAAAQTESVPEDSNQIPAELPAESETSEAAVATAEPNDISKPAAAETESSGAEPLEAESAKAEEISETASAETAESGSEVTEEAAANDPESVSAEVQSEDAAATASENEVAIAESEKKSA
ncbi:MAG: S1 RNA-binding domain-containing protein [Acidobacteriota bacterium]|nr:S1 RNA-binding domain-containing protein [Blastocatellia bacterium]MDQ3489885.1 S1 RNA-binding domain-containing protein [Acidobacteriota bacterium]